MVARGAAYLVLVCKIFAIDGSPLHQCGALVIRDQVRDHHVAPRWFFMAEGRL